jgi:hypothetical protein
MPMKATLVSLRMALRMDMVFIKKVKNQTTRNIMREIGRTERNTAKENFSFKAPFMKGSSNLI